MGRNRKIKKAADSKVPRVYRQGDVVLVAVMSLPTTRKPRESDGGPVVLALGEQTGHAHVIPKGAVQFDAENATEAAQQLLASVGLTVEVTEQNAPTFIEVPSDAAIVHEEHGTIELPAGKYVKLQQREYSPVEIRTVAD